MPHHKEILKKAQPQGLKSLEVKRVAFKPCKLKNSNLKCSYISFTLH